MYANLPVNHIWDGDLSWDDPAVQEHIEKILAAPWYEDDEDGFLYIVLEDSIEGPDNAMADTMLAALRLGVCTDWTLDEHLGGLTCVSPVLHRFNHVDGFYHA